MIDDALVLRVERLRDDVEQLQHDILHRYKTSQRPVTSAEIRDTAARLGERWLVEIASRDDVREVVGPEAIADLNIEFQRLITYSEQSTQRLRYDAAARSILEEFRTRVVVPLKQARYRAYVAPVAAPERQPGEGVTSAFIGQSFSKTDAAINSAVGGVIDAYGLKVITGEAPKADSVSKKVRERIEAASIFVGIFTRRDRLKGRNEWTTSPWVIDEKAYALANRKKLILLREAGVQSIGGIQGDYEYVEFTRDDLITLVTKLVQLLRGLRP
jgi:hypothetical protein